MRLTKCAAAAVLGGTLAFAGAGTLLRADEMAGDAGHADHKPAKVEKAADKNKKLRLPKRYNDLTGLTDEQRQQIDAIHDKAVADIKAIEERERMDILPLLTPEQKAELTAADERMSTERKEKAAKKKDEKSAAAATQPTAG